MTTPALRTPTSAAATTGDAVHELERLLREGDVNLLAGTVLRHGVEALGATGGSLALLDRDGDTLELVAAIGYPPEVVDSWRRFAADDRLPLGWAVRHRERLVVHADSPLLTPEPDDPPRSGAATTACIPLILHGEVLGALGFTFDEPWTADDVHLGTLDAAAEIITRALDRSRRARAFDWMARGQAVVVQLLAAHTPAEVAAVIVEGSAAAVGAGAAGVSVFSADRARLETLASVGYPADVEAELASLDASQDGYPLVASARSGTAVYLESAAEAHALFPHAAPVLERIHSGAIAAVPLSVDGTTLGSIRFSFAGERIFDSETRGFIEAVAALCAQALDRALRAEQHDRTTRLHAVAASLGRAATAQDVAQVIVDAGVDSVGAIAGAVAVREGDALEVLAARGFSPDVAARWHTIPLDVRWPMVDVVDGANLMLIGSLEERDRLYPAGLPTYDAVQARASATIPLRTEAGVLGAFALMFGEERTFTQQDERFFVTLGELCAQALERGWLFEEVRTSREQLHRLLDRLDDAVLSVGRDLRIEYANRRATLLLGRRGRVGTPLAESWNGLALRALTADVAAGRTAVVQARAVDAKRVYDVIALRGDTGAILVVRDVSVRERRHRAEREFVQNAAHELRGPLAAITSAVEALELGAKDEAWTRDHFVSGIADEVERLNRLVRALLILARAQADPEWLTPAPVEVEPILVDIVRTLDTKPGVRVSVRCEPGATVLGEPTLLSAALMNLARNAARSTEQGSISLTCSAAEEGRRRIVVRDSGSGLPPEVEERLFERFARGSGEVGEGFGLGLSIARSMVTAIGGSLELASSPGEGVVATTTLRSP